MPQSLLILPNNWGDYTRSVQKDSDQIKLIVCTLRSYWALSPSKYSPPLLIHCSQHFFQFWKHSCNSSFGILHSSASKSSLVSTDANCHPFSTNFSLVKRQKSTATISGGYGGWGMSVISCYVRKSWISREECATVLSWWNNHFFPLPQISPFSPHCLSAFSSPLDNIYSLFTVYP